MIHFDVFEMCVIFHPVWVRKLTGKPAFLTIADCESEARRIHLTGVGDRQNGVPKPNGFIFISGFNRLLNGSVFRLIDTSAQHYLARFSRRQFRASNLFSFCHTIIVDRNIVSVLPLVNVKNDMAYNLETTKKVLAVSMLAE